MLRRTLRYLCSQTPSHLRELLHKSQTLQQNIQVSEKYQHFIYVQLKNEDKKLATRNKQIHQLRSQLTNDVMKGEEIWKNARKKSQVHKKESIENFAKSLTSMAEALKQVKKLEQQTHDSDIRQGFDLTSRLFFSTLQKYKIVSFSPAPKTKFNKQQMIAQKQVKAQKEGEKGCVAAVSEPGYTADGKVIHKAKVHVYV